VLGEPVVLEACRVELARYPRRRRCVLRYDLAGTRGTSREPTSRTLFGKLGADHPGQAEALLGALSEHAGAAPYPFRVPRLVAARSDLRLDVLEKIPGAPQIGPLVKSRVLGTPAESAPIALDDAVQACAGILSVLHGWRIEVGRRRTLDRDLSALRPELEAVNHASPNLGAQLNEWTRLIADKAAAFAPFLPKLSHGDYTHDQILFEDGAIGLLDFDGLCLAEPALDLGQFCAYLRMACAKAERGAQIGPSGLGDQLSDRFVRTYVQAAEVPRREVPRLRGRIRVYEAVRLVRICVHSWQQLKAARLSTALSVLEEEVACLSKCAP
jgi:Ser/Thr protein kinase RdoA (MazF antagonist)